MVSLEFVLIVLDTVAKCDRGEHLARRVHVPLLMLTAQQTFLVIRGLYSYGNKL